MVENAPYITKEELSKLLDDETVSIVDVRSNWAASDLKVKNAEWENPNNIAGWIQKYAKHQSIVVYCSTPQEKDSQVVAHQLRSAGFESVRVLQGGWVIWKASGYPTQKRLKAPLPEGLIKDIIRE